jgi:iron complex outermembrane recepter protein
MRNPIQPRSATLGTAVFTTLVAAGATMPALAQQAGGLEEIIVTAQRRAESEQRVPIAVNAFSAADLEVRRIVSMNDIAARTPSFVADSQGPEEPNFYIRGVGSQAAGDATAEMPISVYVDDVYVARSAAANFQLFDLERVEVLRGPQGTLFGRNASAGVIHLITKKPQDTQQGKLRFSTGNYSQIGVDAMVTGPITDNLFYKVAGSARTRDGFYLNETTGNDVADDRGANLRAALRYLPGESTEINFSTDFLRERGTSAAHDTVYSPNSPLPAVSNPEPFVTNADTDGHRDREIFSATLRVDHDLGWAEVTSITGYRRNESNSNWYFAGNPRTDDTNESLNGNIEDARQFSEELRLAGTSARLDWIVGLYYLDISVDRTEDFDQWFHGLFKGLGLPPERWAAGDGYVAFDQRADTTSAAAFAQATYRITDKLGVTAGVRYTRDEVDSSVRAWTDPPGAAPVGLGTPGGYDTGTLAKTWSATTPHFSIKYQATENAMMYASATEGYKSGVYNGTASTLADAIVPLEPEKVWSYEAGAKTQWLDNRLRANVNAFYAEFENLQIGTLIPGQALIRENASAKVRGAELELLAVPIDPLTFGLNYSYLNNEFTDPTRDGKVMPRSPKNKVNLYGSYAFELGRELSLVARADWTKQSKFFHEPDNRPSEIQDAYDLLDVSLDLTHASKSWTLSFWGKNVTDTLYTLSQVSVPAIGQNYVTYGAPRTYGVSLMLDF